MSGTGNVVMLGVVLFGECDIQFAVQHLDVEWRIPRRHIRIGETVHHIELAVEHIDGAVSEVCRIEKSALSGRADREAFIDRAAATL